MLAELNAARAANATLSAQLLASQNEVAALQGQVARLEKQVAALHTDMNQKHQQILGLLTGARDDDWPPLNRARESVWVNRRRM